ncbi:MAG: universal stress protein [Bacteroidales bacterium]|nr:universal stress protein [Bacteroidales bacterium]
MSDSVVTIAVHNYSRAQVLKSRLNAEGIECYLKNVNLVHSAVPGGVEVRVNEDDMEAALRIVEKVSEEYRDEEPAESEESKKIQRILVPVDFSMYSKNACRYAIGLAEKLNAHIKLLHVYYNPIVNSMPMTDTYYYQVNMDEIIRDIELRAKEQMEKFYQEIKEWIEQEEIKNITLDYALVRGISHEEILIQAEEYNPDVIVIGSRGKGEKSTDLMGGVTRKIIENAPVPVLAIPEASEYKGISNINIMYVTDFDDSDFKAIRKLMNIISPFSVRLYCVHITSPETNEWDQVKMDGLKKHIKEEYGHQHFECDLIEKEDKLKGIQEFIEEKSIDILSLVTHKRNIIEKIFNPGIEKKLLFHTNVPLLVFHAER